MRKILLYISVYFLSIFNIHAANVTVGAERLDQYLPLLKGKAVGIVVNPTSMVGNTHLLDTLISLGVNVKAIFAPEHGFRGTADAGEHIKNGVDTKTNVAILSLYGDTKKPQLQDLDIVIFDIQDVGARFYTYLNTLYYVMEACAEQKKQLLILDRPNPNGHYVDGPVLDTNYRSFIGMLPVPVVHGMTAGEYARMLNGEKWLSNKVQCALTVIPCLNYNHKIFYSLPVKPSPNLPDMTAIYLYPSLCFFEGTNSVSVGRGTEKPFQIYGSPEFPNNLFSFTPESKPGATKPFLQDQKCYGYDLSGISLDSLRHQKFTLKYLLNAYKLSTDKKNFFSDFFYKLSGGKTLRTQIEKGYTEKQIRATWQAKLAKFKTIRKKYLLYKDFQ
ncbi:MAG: hypothetical protein JWN78_2391 [Bacteroidota bacterium]|nr:hypothetical protein [Bacteroidota bacterium]